MDCIVFVTKAWRSPLAKTTRTEMVIFCYVALPFVDSRELKNFRREGMIDGTTLVE
jgi:hypothetical protein